MRLNTWCKRFERLCLFFFSWLRDKVCWTVMGERPSNKRNYRKRAIAARGLVNRSTVNESRSLAKARLERAEALRDEEASITFHTCLTHTDRRSYSLQLLLFLTKVSRSSLATWAIVGWRNDSGPETCCVFYPIIYAVKNFLLLRTRKRVLRILFFSYSLPGEIHTTCTFAK